MNRQRDIEAVIHEHAPGLMKMPGVTGVAQGEEDGKPCVVVYVVRANDKIRMQLPSTIGGYPVVVQESGELGPLR